MIKHIQFADEKEEEIVSVFCGEQDKDRLNFLGEVEETDPRYVAFLSRLNFRSNT